MTRTASTVAPALLLAAAIAAQAPETQPAETPRAAAAADTELVSLHVLTGDTVYSRQPLQSPPTPAPAPAPAPAPPMPASDPQPQPPQGQGTVADRPFAVVRDAQFAPDGRLVALLVDAPAGGERDAAPRLLPAKSVQWDAATRRWLTAQPTLQLAELTAHDPGKGTKSPAATLAGRIVLASELLTATWVAPRSGDAPAAVEASASKESAANDAAPRIVWWFAPAHQQLAFAVVSHGGKFVPIPWSAVRTSSSAGKLEAKLDNPASASDLAPNLASAAEAPAADVRRRCYEHYGAPTPPWDRAGEPTKGKTDAPTGRGDRR